MWPECPHNILPCHEGVSGATTDFGGSNVGSLRFLSWPKPDQEAAPAQHQQSQKQPHPYQVSSPHCQSGPTAKTCHQLISGCVSVGCHTWVFSEKGDVFCGSRVLQHSHKL